MEVWGKGMTKLVVLWKIKWTKGKSKSVETHQETIAVVR